MSKLKTVWDAVNELRGDLSNVDCSLNVNDKNLYFNKTENNYIALISKPIWVPEVYEPTCTIEEFNKLVEGMMLGLDVNPVNHGHYSAYVNADKTILEKETKPDYTSLEFWKDAPEGAQYYKADCEKFFASWYKDITDHSYKTWVVGKSHNWTHCNYKSPCLIENMVKRPQSTPTETPEEKEALDKIFGADSAPNPLVYTQEMVDNGELPKVGMEVVIDDNYSDVWDDSLHLVGCPVQVMAVFDGLGIELGKSISMVSVSNKGGSSACFRADMCKPIDQRTKKEKAIDELRDFDNSICNDIEWHANFLQAIIDGKITGVKWVGE